MWVVVLVTVGLAIGPSAEVILAGGLHPDRAACEAAVAANVPTALDAEPRADGERGERAYVCERLRGSDLLHPPR